MKTIKKQRGRPVKALADTKSASLLLRLEPREKEGFGDAAEIAGIPLSVWIRERLRQIAIVELERAGRPVPFIAKGK